MFFPMDGSSPASTIPTEAGARPRRLRSYRTLAGQARTEAPTARDAVHPNLCLRCGYVGPHSDSAQCIATLRDRIADLETGRG